MSFSGWLLCFLFLSSLSFAHPVDRRVLMARSMSTSSTLAATASKTTSLVVSGSPATDTTDLFDINALLKGNQRFLGMRSNMTTSLAEHPGVMFIGCTDNRLTPNEVFQTPIGSTISQINLGNQYTRKDASADSAVAYAVSNLHVQHIVVLGHYGCQSVHTAMASQPVDGISQTWLQPITDTFSRSKRPEIKKVIRARRWHDDAGAADADHDAFRALVEENVKTTVKNLQKESILSIAYNKRNKNPSLQVSVFVHGLVLDEESGEVKDLGVSFGPPGQAIPKLPFEVMVEPTIQNSFGKFKPKAKKLSPTSTSTATAASTTDSLSPTSLHAI